MSLSDFQCSELSKDYWVDMRCCFAQGVVNEDMLFELFGKFSEDDTITVRANMIREVKSYKLWYERAAFILNIMKSDSIDSWLNIMKYEGIKGDEISLHTLAWIYNRHIVVHTKGRPWTTMKLDDTITESHLSEVCNVHLLYMDNYVFAELKRKPYSTPNPHSIVTDLMQQIQAMKKSIYNEVPTPLNLSSVTTKVSTATVTSEQASTLSTNEEHSPTMSSTNVQQATSDMTGDNIDVSQMMYEGTTSADTNPVPVYGQPVFPAAKQILLLHPDLSEEDAEKLTEVITHKNRK